MFVPALLLRQDADLGRPVGQALDSEDSGAWRGGPDSLQDARAKPGVSAARPSLQAVGLGNLESRNARQVA